MKPEDCSISPLASVLQWLDIVVDWHHQEWIKREVDASVLAAEDPIAIRRAKLLEHCSAESVPQTFIAHKDAQPIGSISLVKYQFTEDGQQSHWITNLYVEPEFRNFGVGSFLLEIAIDYAHFLRLDTLLLYTHDKTSFYEDRGWVPMMKHTIQGEECDVLRYSLNH